MAGIKAELEDLAFKFLEPEEYRALADQLAARRAEREQMIRTLRIPLESELRRANVPDFEVTGRPKHLWSIATKMKRRGTPLEQIYDMMAVRVIVPSVPECYHVLGIIHHRWTPLQERFKDYIASPKSNGYQSLTPRSSGPAAISSKCRSGPRRCTAPRNTVSPRTGSTKPTTASPMSWIATSDGSASSLSCSRTPRAPRNSSNS
jgi:hypothetical protein